MRKQKNSATRYVPKVPKSIFPRLSSPVDILQWVRTYKKITVMVDNDLAKLALIKQSLVGSDKVSTHHLDSIPEVLNYI